MTVRVKTLAGVALALAMFGGQSAAHADAAPELLESRDDGWRALAPIGWALDEWEDAVGRFGDLVELLPQPAEFVCETVGRFNPVVRLQCAYWDRVSDHLGGDGDDGDDEGGDSDERGGRDERDGRGERSSGDEDPDDRSSNRGDSEGGSRQADTDGEGVAGI